MSALRRSARRPLLIAPFAALVLGVLALPARAQTAAEIKCRDAIAKNLGKFVSTALKDVTGCHAKRSAGKIPLSVNCNDLFSIPGNKSIAAYAKASKSMSAACPDSLTSVLAQYARCPSPHSVLDDDGATDGIDSFKEATDCVLNLAATLTNGASATVLGYPRELPTKDAAKCQRTVGKSLRKRIVTIGKTRRSCQKTEDQQGGGVGYNCSGYDDGKIEADLVKMNAKIAKSCDVPQEDLVPLGGCGQTAGQYEECAGRISTLLGGGLVAEAYELPSTCRLGGAALFINAGIGKKRTTTRFEVGYNGLGHGVDLLDGFEGAVKLDCNDDCVNCQVTIDPIKDRPNSFCRCEGDSTVHCDTVNGPDADDCGGGTCTCMFAPPLPLSAANTPACVVNKLVSELEGVADGGTGVSTTLVRNTSVVHLGISQTAPCPTCDGDVAPNDGLLNGTCSGGARSGLSCDENAASPDFGPVSYDCLPSVGQNISGGGLKLRFDITSVATATLGATLLDGGNPVFCKQCSGDPAIGCNSDADCAASSAGTCSVNTGPPARANGCDDGICSSADEVHTGICEANDLDAFCDGITRVDGKGLISCNVDADCDALDSICPGSDCGSCSLFQQRSCFPDPVGAVGSDGVVGTTPSSGVYGADLVGLLCVPPTNNFGINTSAGLPGPARLLLNFDFEGRCASDRRVVYDIPGGANCP